MKIEDCKTLPEFFGVEGGDIVWIEGEPFLVYKGLICGENVSSQTDSKALVGCLTGQLEWSKEPPKPEITEDEEFGNCKRCGYEFNSELISEYEIKYCPKCGRKIEKIIVPAMTVDEENLLREIAAWFPCWRKLVISEGHIPAVLRSGGFNTYPFGLKGSCSKAYEVLAPILEKYGEIDLGDYRKGNA